MRSRLIVPVLLAVALAACADRATSPFAPTDVSLDEFGEPPPPSLDTTAAFSGSLGQFSIFRVQYFLNKTEKNGFISFHSNTTDSQFAATPNARISYHTGVVSGRGVLTFIQDAGTSVFDLANVSSRAVFNPDCLNTCASFTLERGTFTNRSGESRATTGFFTVAPVPRVTVDGF